MVSINKAIPQPSDRSARIGRQRLEIEIAGCCLVIQGSHSERRLGARQDLAASSIVRMVMIVLERYEAPQTIRQTSC